MTMSAGGFGLLLNEGGAVDAFCAQALCGRQKSFKKRSSWVRNKAKGAGVLDLEAGDRRRILLVDAERRGDLQSSPRRSLATTFPGALPRGQPQEWSMTMHAHHPFISVSIAMGQRAPLAVLGCRDTSSDVAPARQRVEK